MRHPIRTISRASLVAAALTLAGASGASAAIATKRCYCDAFYKKTTSDGTVITYVIYRNSDCTGLKHYFPARQTDEECKKLEDLGPSYMTDVYYSPITDTGPSCQMLNSPPALVEVFDCKLQLQDK